MEHPKLAQCLRQIAAGTLSRAAAAEILGCSGRQVNREMKLYGVERPPAVAALERKQVQEDAKARKELLAKLTLAVFEGKLTLPAATKASGVSLRTMYRWVERFKLSKSSKKRPKKQ